METRRLKKAIYRLRHLPKNKYLFAYLNNKKKNYLHRKNNSLEVAYPSTIMLELTNHCNLHCTTCAREYGYGKEMDKGFITFEQAKNVIDELWCYLDSIGLTGMGETFMYKDIDKIVDYIKSKNKGIIISISTNAMLPDFIERASKVIDKIDTIQISIDGIDDTYELIRKNAKFSRLTTNVTELVKLAEGTKTSLMFNMVVTKENYHQMSDLIAYSSKIGVKYLNFTILNLASLTETEVDYYDFYHSKEFLETLTEVNNAKAKFKDVEVSFWDYELENGFNKCSFPWSHFYVCWDGYVTPCCAKPFPKELHFGNVFEEGVMNVLNSKAYQKFRQLWYDNKTPRFCEKCHFIDFKPIQKKELH